MPRKKPKAPHCPLCGSANVSGTGSAYWDIETQDWCIGDVEDTLDCDDCMESFTDADWQEVK